MKNVMRALLSLAVLLACVFQSDWFLFNEICNAQQDRTFLARQRLKKTILDVEIALEKGGGKLASNSSKEKYDLEPKRESPMTLSGELRNKEGVAVTYYVSFHEDANRVELVYSSYQAISGYSKTKILTGIGDKAAEITFGNGNKNIIFKRGNYVVVLGFPPTSFSHSTELVNHFIKAIDKHKEQ
jgi:hypothetical protein